MYNKILIPGESRYLLFFRYFYRQKVFAGKSISCQILLTTPIYTVGLLLVQVYLRFQEYVVQNQLSSEVQVLTLNL